MFTETHSPYLSNWTPWYDSKHKSIHLYSFKRTPGCADKEIIIHEDGKWNFCSEGHNRNTTGINVFVGLPEQLLRMKSLLKLLEITEKCKMCNGCGNSKEYENLSSETSIFKKKEGREGVLHENNLLRSADCSILLKHDEPDKCPSCKICNHYLGTVMSRKKNAEKISSN